MNALQIPHRLGHGATTCRAVVETPAGRRSKFGYDAQTGLFELSGVLLAGMAFPLAFGFIQSTRGQDGDPLDVLILADEDLPVGCLVTLRLLGVIGAVQSENGRSFRNDRLIGRVAHLRELADMVNLERLGHAFVDEMS